MLEYLAELLNVVYYPYRSGDLTKFVFQVPRWAVKPLEDALYLKAGIKDHDNHVCFSFNWRDHGWSDFEAIGKDWSEEIDAVMFSDFHAYFGIGVKSIKS